MVVYVTNQLSRDLYERPERVQIMEYDRRLSNSTAG